MRAISNAVEVAPPASVSESVSALGGSRAAAEVLGVAQRTIERYTKFEREGRGPNTREASAAAREQLAAAAGEEQTDAALAKIRREGLSAHYHGEANVSGETGRVREFDVQIEPGDALDAMIDAYEDGHGAALAGAFEGAVGQFYTSGMELGDVDELSMEF